MSSPWLACGAACCTVSVIAGAFGAHGLESRLSAPDLENWEIGARYLMYGGLGLLVLGLRSAPEATAWPPILLLAGSVIFSATLFVLALGGPRWFGAITPLGGLGMILGFALLGWEALRG
ncbi:MAG: DUF423 domain-containing protein [Thermoanaerobaculia bacterium]|nr:DUF423 domain-containing protein [Thermoanaerobaculia bacterium]